MPARTVFEVGAQDGAWQLRCDGLPVLTTEIRQLAIDEARRLAEHAPPAVVHVLDRDGVAVREWHFDALDDTAVEWPRSFA